MPRVNEEGTVVGFGITETTPKEIAPNKQLKSVYLMAMSNSVCATALPGVNTATNFCARDDQPDSMNICQGDVGSAYVIVHRGQQFLVNYTRILRFFVWFKKKFKCSNRVDFHRLSQKVVHQPKQHHSFEYNHMLDGFKI